MATERPMTESPPALARTAPAAAREALAAYSSKFSRKDFTQHQHFTLLALREFLRTDYRGLEAMLGDWAEAGSPARSRAVQERSVDSARPAAPAASRRLAPSRVAATTARMVNFDGRPTRAGRLRSLIVHP